MGAQVHSLWARTEQLLQVLIQYLNVGICSDMWVGRMWFMHFPSDEMSVLRIQVCFSMNVYVYVFVTQKFKPTEESACAALLE